MKSIVYGEIIWDIFPEEQVIGGAPFNFAAHLSHLGNETYLISAVGNDELGDKALKMAELHGVKADLIQKNEYKTGACIVSLNEEGKPSYDVLFDVAYDNITVDNKVIEEINSKKPDLFYFNTLIQRREKSKKSLIRILENCNFTEILCDINIRKKCFDAESVDFCMKKSTIVKISDEESHFLYDINLIRNENADFIKDVAESYPNIKLVVYTLGKKGSEVYDTVNKILYKSDKPANVKVVSTVGAGDCFFATFADGFLKGEGIQSSILAATKRSDIVVSHREAIPF